MADTPPFSAPSAGQKRSRDDDDDDDDDFDVLQYAARLDKKARPTSGESSISDSFSLAQDSVINTPKSLPYADHRKLDRPPYDSDDQDSMVSEPGSLQDVTMSSNDDPMEDHYAGVSSQTHHEDPERSLPQGSWPSLHSRIQQTNRVPTPILPQSSRLGDRAIHIRTSFKQHVRHRHPQEIAGVSSDLLEVPSPIDEDEVPTPPSAAEAAGSQLSMLTVNDMDMEAPESVLPTISVDPSQTLPFGEHAEQSLETESAIADGFDPMESNGGLGVGLIVRKQRARSGALSSGHGSPAPGRGDSAHPEMYGAGAVKRGFSLGFRADCEKCQMRVPGHMNHFI